MNSQPSDIIEYSILLYDHVTVLLIHYIVSLTSCRLQNDSFTQTLLPVLVTMIFLRPCIILTLLRFLLAVTSIMMFHFEPLFRCVSTVLLNYDIFSRSGILL
jgi:cell shape-determining protein MreD